MAGPRLSLGPDKQQEIAYDASMSLEGERNELVNIRNKISGAQQKDPVRAFAVSMSQIFQNTFGGREQMQLRAKESSALADFAQKQLRVVEKSKVSVTTNEETQQELMALPSMNTNQQAQLGQLQADRPALDKALADATGRWVTARDAADKKSDTILSKKRQIGGQAMGFGVMLGANMLYGAGLAALNEGMKLLGEAMGPAVDAVMGFASASKEASTQMSATVKGSGLGSLAEAQTKGGLGMAAGVDISALTKQSSIQAMLENYRGGLDLTRANERYKGMGDEYGFGGLKNGLVPGVPLLEEIGQTQGLGELLNRQFGDQALTAPAGEGGSWTGNGEFGGAKYVPGNIKIRPEDVMNLDTSSIPGVGGQLARWQQGELRTQMALPEADRDQGKIQLMLDGLTKVFDVNRVAYEGQGLSEYGKAATSNLNATLKKAGFGGQYALSTDAKAIQDTYDGIVSMSPALTGFAEKLKASNIALTGVEDTAFGAAESMKALQGMDVTQDPQVLLDQMKPTIEAAIRGSQRQLAFTRTSVIPTQTATNLAAAPLSTKMYQGLDVKAVSPEILGTISSARVELQAMADAGETAGRAMADAAGLGPMWQEQFDAVKGLGREISDLSSTAQDLQLGAETKAYNLQLFIAKRNVGDLIGMAGQQTTMVNGQVIAATKLGSLNRAQLMDQRELTKISLARSKREIEFGIAISRLNTPGATGAERATRRHEADLIAAEQKRELALNTRMTGRGFRIQDIGITREARDAVKQLGLMETQRSITLEVRGIEAAIGVKQQLLDVKKANLGAVTSTAETIKGTLLSAAQQVEEASKDAVPNIMSIVDETFKGIVEGAVTAYNDFVATTDSDPNTKPSTNNGGEGQEGWGPQHASGYIGTTTGTTRFTAGEAGSEHVVVLRNPRTGMMNFGGRAGGGGGGVNIAVNFNGHMSVRSEGDIQEIARQVERALNRKASLLGVMSRG